MSVDGQIFIQGLQLEQAEPISVIVAETDFCVKDNENSQHLPPLYF